MRLRSLILIMMTAMIGLIGEARGAPEADESLGTKVKNFFVQPTPRPRKRHKASPTPQKTPTPKASPAAKKKRRASPTASPKASASASPDASVAPSASATPSPTETPKAAADTPTPGKASEATPTPSSTRGKTKKGLAEPVRPISPGPRRKHLKSPSPGASISPANAERSPAETPTVE